MRPATAMELKVGLLIVAGLIATVALFLATDRIRFDRHYRVAAYVADAAGLRQQSPVTLSGRRIGEVEDFDAVNDPRGNIRVVLRINQRYLIPADATLTIASSGIFGDSYLAFSGSGKPGIASLATDGSAEVKASGGFLDKAGKQAETILAGASDLLSLDTRQDAKRLVKGAADLAEAGVRVAAAVEQQSKALGETLASVKALSDELRVSTRALSEQTAAAVKRIDQTLAASEGQIERLAARAGTTLDRVDALADGAGKDLKRTADETAAALQAFQGLSARIQRIAQLLESGEGVLGQLLTNRELAKDLNNAAIDLSRTATFLAEHPEALVWGAEAGDAAAQRARREREKQRRAYHELYGGVPLQVAPAAEPPRP
jgi:phospholipid/cholesterol/gamma-HCH transport system substrate-binding protein